MSELNLIPYELKVKRIKKLKTINIISYGIIAVAILFAIVYVPKLYLNKIILNELNLDNKISSNSKIIEENKKLLLDIKNYELYDNEVASLTKQTTKVFNKIKDIEKYIPIDVSLTGFAYSKGIITLSGTSLNYSSISSFAASLQMSKEYPIANIENINNVVNETSINGKVYTFTISLGK